MKKANTLVPSRSVSSDRERERQLTQISNKTLRKIAKDKVRTMQANTEATSRNDL